MFNSPSKDSNTINLKDASCDMDNSLSDAAHNAGRKVRGMFHTASDEITHASEHVTSEIRTNPLRSSAIALGIGMLLGTLFRK